MTGVLTLYRSSIGKKAAMAITGLLMVLFVFVHMIGNLKVYYGPGGTPEHPLAMLDVYGRFLREMGYPILGHEQGLWIARLLLLGAVGLHVWSASQLTERRWTGRDVKYVQQKTLQASWASRTMLPGGVIIGLFIIGHLLHLTLGYFVPTFKDGAVYLNVVNGLKGIAPWLYIFAMLPLGLHIYHGLWSFFQTLGWNSQRSTELLRGLALLVALLVVVGNISVVLTAMMTTLPS